jgi:hypothetical protein
MNQAHNDALITTLERLIAVLENTNRLLSPKITKIDSTVPAGLTMKELKDYIKADLLSDR